METTASTSVSGAATMMSPSSSSRRRHRPSPPAANASDRSNDHGDQKSSITPRRHHHEQGILTVEVAKARFVQTIRDSMHTLMTDYGFSRERATAALLRELSAVAGLGNHSPQQVEQPFTENNNASSPLPLVKDEQVFDAMQQYGLSAEQAMRALTVSTTLERVMSSSPRRSLAEALHNMTNQLSRANLGDRLSSEHEPGSHEEPANQHSLPRVLPPKSLLPDKKRSLPPPQRLTVVKPSQSSSSSSAKKARPSSSSSSSKSSSKKVKETGASNDPAAPLPSRARSDSVTERVTAKLAVVAAEGTGGGSSNSSSSSSDPSHRVIKRAREQQQSEDAPSVGSNKRSRTNTA